MSNNNKIEVSQVKNVLNDMKMEIASEFGIDLKSANLTAKDAGRVGGEITRRLIKKAEEDMQ